METCSVCPRNCNAERENSLGFCGVGNKIKIAKIMPHFYEEPPISGENGSGAIFFSGCNLKCVYCQNYPVSRNEVGKEISKEALAEEILKLQNLGVHNINLVSPTQFAPQIKEVLLKVKDRLFIPVIYNSGGYESVETLKTLEGLVDVYLPDLKYFSAELSKKYSACPDYFEKAIGAIAEMTRQTGKPIFENGLIKKGTIVRHLVLPGQKEDSKRVLEALKEQIGVENILLSLMRQYTPEFLKGNYPELNRRVTTFEYTEVLKVAEDFGFEGFTQGKESADKCFTPDFK